MKVLLLNQNFFRYFLLTLPEIPFILRPKNHYLHQMYALFLYIRLTFLILLSVGFSVHEKVKLPIQIGDRDSVQNLHLTEIGKFGITRKARPGIPKHLHTGIDIKRPHPVYDQPQYLFPIAKGTVISKREDGPFAQLIIAHKSEESTFWTVYEHIAEIKVALFQPVDPDQPLARFFNKSELDAYGWQFDHFHFEILKERPYPIAPSSKNPERRHASYTLVCYDQQTLEKYFYHPLEFLQDRL
ncbi:MAG: M23 family metallopeptidase [Bacteroidota bacterium]